MAAALALAAAAPTYAVLLAALAVYGPASGLGTQLAQAALLAAAPGRHEAVLARWELLAAVGDLLAPVVLAASVALGLGWRGALLLVGGVAAFQAAAVARAPAGADAQGAGGEAAGGDGAGDDAPLREALRAALGCPRLLAWSAAVALCGFMDEVLVSFGALWLAERRGLDATARAAVLACHVLGAIAGAALLERAARRIRPAPLLLAAGLGSGGAYLLWLGARGPVACAGLAALVGLFTAAHYPLLRARAFAALPGRANVVLAVGSAFTAVDLAVPVLVGLVADRAGLLPAMLLLLLQPLGVVAAGLAVGRRSRARRR